MANQADFRYQGVPIDSNALCAQNSLHAYLFNRGLQNASPTLITFNNRPKVAGRVDASELMVDRMPIDTLMARAQAQFLSEQGLRISAADLSGKLRESLVTSYLLSSSICVASVKAQRGTAYALVTKSPEMVSALRSQFSAADKRKGLDHFNEQFSTTYEELIQGSFSSIRLLGDVDGIHVTKLKVATRSARNLLLPYYSLNNFAARLVEILNSYRVEMTFRNDDGAPVPLLTTLHTGVVAQWLGTSRVGAEYAKWADWSSPVSFGYLSLPSLSRRGEMASVPVLQIESLKPARHR